MDNQDKKPRPNKEIPKAEEPATAYNVSKKQGIGEDFDFDTEFAKGLTVEEAKEIAVKKIRAW